MKPGDIVQARFPYPVGRDGGGCGIYLGEYVSINQVTGEEYVCAEVMWFHDDGITTYALNALEVVREAV